MNVTTDVGASGSARFSTDRRWRYVLTRDLGLSLYRTGPGPRRTVVFAMLNPSTADAFVLDPTVRRCVGFAERDLYDRLVVVNLYALRSTDPRGLYDADDPVGPDNPAEIAEALRVADAVVCAWGTHPAALAARGRPGTDVVALAAASGVPTYRLGAPTRDGHPRHPLYLRADTPLVPHTEGPPT